MSKFKKIKQFLIKSSNRAPSSHRASMPAAHPASAEDGPCDAQVYQRKVAQLFSKFEVLRCLLECPAHQAPAEAQTQVEHSSAVATAALEAANCATELMAVQHATTTFEQEYYSKSDQEEEFSINEFQKIKKTKKRKRILKIKISNCSFSATISNCDESKKMKKIKNKHN